jgi:hypothetical protein
VEFSERGLNDMNQTDDQALVVYQYLRLHPIERLGFWLFRFGMVKYVNTNADNKMMTEKEDLEELQRRCMQECIGLMDANDFNILSLANGRMKNYIILHLKARNVGLFERRPQGR